MTWQPQQYTSKQAGLTTKSQHYVCNNEKMSRYRHVLQCDIEFPQRRDFAIHHQPWNDHAIVLSELQYRMPPEFIYSQRGSESKNRRKTCLPQCIHRLTLKRAQLRRRSRLIKASDDPLAPCTTPCEQAPGLQGAMPGHRTTPSRPEETDARKQSSARFSSHRLG